MCNLWVEIRSAYAHSVDSTLHVFHAYQKSTNYRGAEKS